MTIFNLVIVILAYANNIRERRVRTFFPWVGPVKYILFLRVHILIIDYEFYLVYMD